MEDQNTNVDELINRLPKNYEQACYDKKAIERKREIKNPVSVKALRGEEGTTKRPSKGRWMTYSDILRQITASHYFLR